MKKIFYTIVSLVLVSQAAFASSEIYHHYRSSRSMGMGGLKTTTGIYEDALFGNPALHAVPETWKVSILNLTAEGNTNIISDASKASKIGSASGGELISKIADSGLIGHNEHERIENVTGFYLPHFFSENNSFAFGLYFSQMMNVHLRTDIDLDLQAYVDAGPAAGFARKFMDGNLKVGVNLRTIYRIAADRTFKSADFLAGKKLSVSDVGGQGLGIDGDLGATYKLPFELPIARFSVGASVNNAASSNYDIAMKNFIKKVTTSPPKNYTNGNVGLRIDLDNFMLLTNNLVALEVQDIGKYKAPISTYKRIHMGAETNIIKVFSVRAGFNQGYYTAGLGINLPVLKIDLATYGEEIGTNAGMLEDRRYIARIGFEI